MHTSLRDKTPEGTQSQGGGSPGVAREAGLDVVEVRYLSSIGLLRWLVMVKVPSVRPACCGGAVPWLSALERHVRPPFGQSVLRSLGHERSFRTRGCRRPHLDPFAEDRLEQRGGR